MSATATALNPTPSPAESEAARHEQRQAMLGRLAEVGLRIALAIERQVEARADASPTTDADLAATSLAYGRVARAVRLTLMLQAQLETDFEAWSRKMAQHASWDVRDAQRDRKSRTLRIVERIATVEGCDEERVEQLVGETGERLDQDDVYGDILARPVSELIAMICKDLGLSPNWPDLAEEAWARDEAASGAVGWPLAETMPGQRPRKPQHEEPEEAFVTLFVPPS